jgi:hypothetical protein
MRALQKEPSRISTEKNSPREVFSYPVAIPIDPMPGPGRGQGSPLDLCPAELALDSCAQDDKTDVGRERSSSHSYALLAYNYLLYSCGIGLWRRVGWGLRWNSVLW